MMMMAYFYFTNPLT